MSSPTVVTRTLEELFGVTDPKVKDAPYEVRVCQSPLVPSIDPNYAFQEDHVRRMLMWLSGIAGRNLLITGPTGCGKSTMLEQLCARIGRELYRVACHGRFEFAELTGQITVMANGSTQFVHGPLPRAMLSGSVLMLDELNFISPSAVGGLNGVLDGGPLLIPETGEVITPHPDFRIAATGNSVDHGDDSALYRGTQRMNLALIQRFVTIRADYLPPDQEAAMLHRVAPALPGKAIEAMVEVASDIRKSFMEGSLPSTISSRTAVKWARVLAVRVPLLVANPEEQMRFGLQYVLTDALRREDALAIEGTLQRKVSGLKLVAPSAASGRTASRATARGASMSASPVPASAPGQVHLVKVHFLVHPNRDGNGSKTWWAAVEPGPGTVDGYSMHGGLLNGRAAAKTPNKDATWLLTTLSQKTAKGYCHQHSLMVPSHQAEAIVTDAVKAVDAAVADHAARRLVGSLAIQCAFSYSREIASAIAAQMGITRVAFNV